MAGNGTGDSTDFTSQQLAQLFFNGYVVSAGIISTIGILGNILNLVVLIRGRFKAIMYTFIKWLSVADTLALAFLLQTVHLGLYPANRTYPNKMAAIYVAHVVTGARGVTFIWSGYLVVFIALDRFLALAYPLRYQTLLSRNRAHAMSLMALIVICVLQLPYAMLEYRVTSARNERDGTNSTLYKVDVYHRSSDSYWYVSVYQPIGEVLFRIFPILLVLVLNVATIRTIYAEMMRRKVSPLAQAVPAKLVSDRKALIAMLLCVSIIYIVCVTPYSLRTIMNSADNDRRIAYRVFKVAANNALYINSSANFYVYSCVLKQYRAEMYRVLNCARISRSSITTSNIQSIRSSQINRIESNKLSCKRFLKIN